MEHLVDFSQTREAPETILERLRLIEPTAELLFWGPRPADVAGPGGKTHLVVVPVWLLGTVRPNGVRHIAGHRLLASQEHLGPRGDRDTWRYARLLYQSFAPVAFYPFREPCQAMVEDFRLRDWMYKNALNAEEQRTMLEAEGVPQLELRKQKLLDKAMAEGPSIWKFAFGGRRHFTRN